MNKFWKSLLLTSVLLLPGCIVVHDDPYYYDGYYSYQYDGVVVTECPLCHCYHTGSCGSPVIVVYCGLCGHYHTGRCHRIFVRRYRHYH